MRGKRDAAARSAECAFRHESLVGLANSSSADVSSRYHWKYLSSFVFLSHLSIFVAK